jgi:hypothetical protein
MIMVDPKNFIPEAPGTLAPITTVGLLKKIRVGLSALPLWMNLGKLSATITPDELVDFSLKCPAIAPMQMRSEFVEYARIVAEQRPSAALEIGSYRGGTLFVLSRLADPDATVITIDLPKTIREDRSMGANAAISPVHSKGADDSSSSSGFPSSRDAIKGFQAFEWTEIGSFIYRRRSYLRGGSGRLRNVFSPCSSRWNRRFPRYRCAAVAQRGCAALA